MSASQARLLFISSRIHDIEMKSMNIANQKIRLASESQQVSTDYAKALNKTKLMVTDKLTNDSEQLRYSTVMSPDGILSSSYSLRDGMNRVVVPEKISQAYDQANGDLDKFLDLVANPSKLSNNGQTTAVQRAPANPSSPGVRSNIAIPKLGSLDNAQETVTLDEAKAASAPSLRMAAAVDNTDTDEPEEETPAAAPARAAAKKSIGNVQGGSNITIPNIVVSTPTTNLNGLNNITEKFEKSEIKAEFKKFDEEKITKKTFNNTHR